MQLIAERIIAYLKADVTLRTLLGSSDNIFAMGLQELDRRKAKYVAIPVEPGEDMNNLPGQTGTFTLEVAVSRNVAGAFGICIDIASRVDTLLNKGEASLSTTGWKIIHLKRLGSPSKGPMVDKDAGEVYLALEYEYLLDESV